MVTKTRVNNMDGGQLPKFSWLRFVNREVILRSTIIAIVIGSVLTLINQFGWVTGRETLRFLPLILVFVTPLVVVAISQAVGIRQAHIDGGGYESPMIPEGFLATSISHGIPVRAVAIGLIVGSINAIIVLSVALSQSGNLATVAVVPLGQAYALPLLFGVLSQAISYRRAEHLVQDSTVGYRK